MSAHTATGARRATSAAATLVLLAALCAYGQSPQPAAPAPAAPQKDAFDPDTLPAIVAKINGADVTRDEVIREARGAYAQLQRMGGKPALDAAFYRTALDQRIAAILLQSEAKSRGVAATPEQVDERMEELRSRYESNDALVNDLAKGGLTVESAREQLHQDLSRYNYIEKVILPEIEISDDTLRQFYDQNLEKMRQPERVKVRQILVAVPKDATEDQRKVQRRRAEEALAKARAGQDFAALAQEYSDDPRSSGQSGELPWLSREEIKLLAFREAAFSLEKGATSDILESPAGFHIVQGVDRQPTRIAEFDEVKDRILALLQGQEAQERLRKTIEGLMAQAKIERFAL
jgi:parvulin-like peptidyl-prolyl isomerase